MSGYNYADLAAFNAARRHRHHHMHHNRQETHEAPAKRSTLAHAGPFFVKKLAGTATAGVTGFIDTYTGMPALGADSTGKGGIGLDLIWSFVTNALDLWGALRAKGPLGGAYLGAGISGTADASWYMWFGKQLQLYGASKKGGAEAEIGSALNYSQRDDARGGTSLGPGAPQSSVQHAENVIFDPLAGFR